MPSGCRSRQRRAAVALAPGAPAQAVDDPVVVRQTGMSTLRAGDSGRLAVDPADVHVFDPETTLRLT